MSATAAPRPILLLASALLALSACNVSSLRVSAVEEYPSAGYGYGGYGYGAPVHPYGYGTYGYGVPAYRVVPKSYWGYPDYHSPLYGGGHFGGGDHWREDRFGWGSSHRENRYANNGRCDDARYRTSNGGRAAPGSDERDCRRFGDGRK
ncbi:hypothetical protein [Azospirillum sp. sgz302134]